MKWIRYLVQHYIKQLFAFTILVVVLSSPLDSLDQIALPFVRVQQLAIFLLIVINVILAGWNVLASQLTCFFILDAVQMFQKVALKHAVPLSEGLEHSK